MEEAKWERERLVWKIVWQNIIFTFSPNSNSTGSFWKIGEKTPLIIQSKASKFGSYLMNVNIWRSPWTSWKYRRVNINNFLIKYYMNMLHVCIICIVIACSLRHILYGNITLESTTLMQICHYKVFSSARRLISTPTTGTCTHQPSLSAPVILHPGSFGSPFSPTPPLWLSIPAALIPCERPGQTCEEHWLKRVTDYLPSPL